MISILESYGILGDIWLYLSIKDIINLSSTSSDIHTLSLQTNRKVPQNEINIAFSHNLSVKERETKIQNIVNFFPKISKLCFRRKISQMTYIEMRNEALKVFNITEEFEVLYKNNMFCQNLKELTVPIKNNLNISSISQFSNLITLKISDSEITDDGLVYLSQLTLLKTLELLRCHKITDAGMLNLSSMINLSSFSLESCYSFLDSPNVSGLTNLTNLNMRSCGLHADNALVHLQSLTKLLKLDLSSNVRLRDISIVPLSNLINLEELYFDSCANITGFFLSRLTSLQNLNILSLLDCNALESSKLSHLSHFKKLTFLMVTMSDSDEGFIHISSLTQLESLNFYKCYNMSSIGLSLLSQLSKLDTLIFCDCKVINDDCLQCFISLRKLNCLVIQKCYNNNITDIGLSYLSSLTNLQHLRLEDCDNITDNGLLAILLLNINILSLMGCNNITDNGLLHISRLANLNDLNIRDCHNINKNGPNLLSMLNRDMALRY